MAQDRPFDMAQDRPFDMAQDRLVEAKVSGPSIPRTPEGVKDKSGRAVDFFLASPSNHR
jgi:hypothetical protein